MTLGAANPSRWVCHGCGWAASDEDPLPFRCASVRAGDDIDHGLVRRLDHAALGRSPAGWRELFAGLESNPFLRYRELLHPYRTARAAGYRDAEYVDWVTRLDERVAAVDGRGFRVTPYTPAPELARAVGLDAKSELWLKDETANVAGSHKARHTMGLLIWLTVMEKLGRLSAADSRRTLAIASCGNAALGAAVVAKAGGWPLQVFIPTDADPAVVERLAELGAQLTVCAREPGLTGDPTVHAFQAAVAAGALPFTCQGNENGLTIDGGKTLGFELVSAWLAGAPNPDRLLIQVGGGALGSAVAQALAEAQVIGALDRLPALDTVQTASCHPLEQAAARLLAESGGDRSRALRALASAARRRSAYMRPWPTTPHSIAHGILDDETYDWVELLRGVLATGGENYVVTEPLLARAHALLKEHAALAASATATAGLAGLLERCAETPPDAPERLALLVTGAERRGA